MKDLFVTNIPLGDYREVDGRFCPRRERGKTSTSCMIHSAKYIRKIDGKKAQQTEADAHRGNCISGGIVGGGGRSTEIRLDASDTKKSMISFGTRRDDSRIDCFYSAPPLSVHFFLSFFYSRPYPVRPYPVSLITGRAIISLRMT